MPRFQLEISICLATSAVSSLLLFYFARPKKGNIQLPNDAEDDSAEAEVDTFGVTKPEDAVEGYPIDEHNFWTKMRLRKLILTFLLALILAVETVPLGWVFASDTNYSSIAVYTHGLDLVFSVYILVLAVRSINQNTVGRHSQYVTHLAVLTSLSVCLMGISAIIPSTTTILENAPALDRLWYLGFFLYSLSCGVLLTTPRGPLLHLPLDRIYSEKTITTATHVTETNVCGISSASLLGLMFFSYTTGVVSLGSTFATLEIGDLPVLSLDMRSTVNFILMKKAMHRFKLRLGNWRPKPGSGWELGYRMLRVNALAFLGIQALAILAAAIYYAPAFLLQKFIAYLEVDPERKDKSWGWVYVIGLFFVNTLAAIVIGQLWSLATTTIQVRLRIQLNSILFAKTLVRRDVASSSTSPSQDGVDPANEAGKELEAKNIDFSSKAEIMTLMTTDVDRVSDFSRHMFTLTDSPIEIFIGTCFLYKLLGVSCFVGLAVAVLLLPVHHFAGKVLVVAQEKLMKARDERVSLTNEILAGIRMLKFMAWERSFEAKVLHVREKELNYQRISFTVETLWNSIANAVPLLFAVVCFWHFAVIRQQILTPSKAFTAIAIFAEMQYAINALPETFINILQGLVSLRRIEKYLNGAEVTSVPPLDLQSNLIAFQSATVTWPQDRFSDSAVSSATSTPRRRFVLLDLSIRFPKGEMTLICGKLGSGKTLLLLALLGEAEVLTGRVLCPRSPPDSLASFTSFISPDNWVVQGVCAYVPQLAWLRNQSIKDNILFNLPFDGERYQKTLEVCALIPDLKILEDGDESEIGESGVNLSGGQKARVSLARAVYSRASILFLDDVLSAVDAHTAHHLYHECLKGDLMRGRTVILVSHHVQLCAPGASYVVALDHGRVQFQGDPMSFHNSGVMGGLIQLETTNAAYKEEVVETQDLPFGPEDDKPPSNTAIGAASRISTATPTALRPKAKTEKKPTRKLVDDEKRAVGRVSRDIWQTYIKACGGGWYWAIFIMILLVAALSPILENWWLKIWSGSKQTGDHAKGPVYYVSIYAAITAAGLIMKTLRWSVLYSGSIHASGVLYQKLLETILFADIRFHDTVSRGRVLNRFGKDFEAIDSRLVDDFGRSVIFGISAFMTFATITIVGGLPFLLVSIALGMIYYYIAKDFGHTSRDMRRLASVTSSPLYSIYGETISGVAVLRSFGASSKFMRDMLRCVDTNTNPCYWMWSLNRWFSVRSNSLTGTLVGVTGLIVLQTPQISASLAGFALTFASTVSLDLMYLIRRFVALEQCMVALERVKEYSNLAQEPPEFMESRPPVSWPSRGAIRCEGLVIRYAPELPDVLHKLNFKIRPGEKVGILGRTGSGKSTLASSLFRFVEATEGRILVDGWDISKIGLTDLRSSLTIIPQDPTILSGSLRSTLDIFNEYEDAEIFEALRRVHLIPSDGTPEASNMVNPNIFRNLDSYVSEGGENFSTGEKQLLCMARAILKRSKVLVMDEATASVDYATDELISKTIRREFAESTILTIAHRLRTVIDYDRVMLLEEGRIVEFARPGVLLANPASRFHQLCRATGKDEFSMLKKMARVYF